MNTGTRIQNKEQPMLSLVIKQIEQIEQKHT